MHTQPSQYKGRRVLVVDDDPEIIQILEINLAHANFEVISAGNGLEVLTKAFKERPDLIILDVILPDLDGLEICRQLKESPQTSHIPVIIISAKVESDDKIAAIVAGAEGYITKPFSPAEVVALAEASLKRVEGDKNVSPLTGLPDRTHVDNHVRTLMSQQKIFAAIHVDIDCLQAFNHVYGFRKGDIAIQLLSEMLREAVWLFGNTDDLVGHLGGDDFVIISTPQKARILCQRIIADFDSRIITLYEQKDLEKGYVEYKGRLGQRERCPIMSLSVSVVTNEKRVFNSHHQVSEIATEIRNYLRRLPGSNFYFDRRDNCLTTMPSLTAKGIPLAYREELKALQGTTAWVAFLTKELETPVTAIQNYLDSQLQNQVQVFDTPGTTGLETIREHVGQLIRTVDGLRHLGELDCDIANTTVMKVDLTTTLDWVISQLEGLAHQQGIRINCAGDQDVRWLMIDGRSLAQGLFYLIRSEIKSAVRGDHLQIHVSETSEEFVSVEVINANRYIPPHELAMLFRGQLENLISNGERNDLYLAKVSVKGFGGELSIDSRKGEGCISSIHIPKRWRSSVGDVSRLQSEVENIAETVRSKVEALHCLLPSIVEQVPSDFEAGLDILTAKTQELEVVCNRALFLADGLTSELDNHQGLVLRQELEQLATSEAMLVANREIARLAQTEEHLFDPESAKRVAKNVLAIADELKLSRSERQSIYYAALLKDLGLISVPQAMVELNLVPTIEKALSYRHHFNRVEKAVSRLNYLAPAISIAKQRYERYDGTGYPSGLKGAKIPLGARILAVVDAFDSMTSGSSKHSLKPERAAKEIAAESGRRFDPRVTGVFLQVWRRGELQVASHKLRLEVSSL